MHRISEPQIVEAFTRSSTSPCPGTGTGTVRISTVLLPGRKAAVIVSFIALHSPCTLLLNLFIYILAMRFAIARS
jgi:hypothetical protein